MNTAWTQPIQSTAATQTMAQVPPQRKDSRVTWLPMKFTPSTVRPKWWYDPYHRAYSRARGSYKAPGANAYDADIMLLEPVQRMALEENIALLFVHHDKKGAGLALDSFERLSGTMGISGSCDCVINLVADGKRFDGRATMEFTPRDAKGGEMSLAFDERFGEWQEVIETKPDLRGNPLCSWIIEHTPERQQEGKTFSYDTIVKAAYGSFVDNPGEEVRKQLVSRREELFSSYGIGIQMGVKSNGARGIRIINLL